VEKFRIPHPGRIVLADLDIHRLRAAFAEIASTTNSRGRPQSPSCLHHLRTTLRAVLNLAVREGVLPDNPARRLEIPPTAGRIRKVWTDGRIREWQATGTRPAVAVWTVDHLVTFLESVTGDRLSALWWLIALRGLRCGEACGLRWSEVDLDHGVLFVVRNRTTASYEVIEGDPKSAAGVRTVALDQHAVAVLREHHRRQHADRARRLAAGKIWYDTGYAFTRPNSSPIHPGYVTQRFTKLTRHADVPPIRLHDRRHGAASLAHDAGADLKTVQDQLGHSSIVITADTYTSVLPTIQRRCAEATARLVLNAARRTRKKTTAAGRRSRPDSRPKTGAPTPIRPASTKKQQVSVTRTTLGPRPGQAPARHPRRTHHPHGTR
jgi:integrase